MVRSFTHARRLSPDPDWPSAALMIARVEYPRLDAGPYLDRLDAIGREARCGWKAAAPALPDSRRTSTRFGSPGHGAQRYLFSELGRRQQGPVSVRMPSGGPGRSEKLCADGILPYWTLLRRTAAR